MLFQLTNEYLYKLLISSLNNGLLSLSINESDSSNKFNFAVFNKCYYQA